MVSVTSTTVDTGDTAFMIVSMALVMFMTPGLAFFYGGLVRQQNVLTIMMQNFVCMGMVTMIWVLWGFSLVFGNSGGLMGDPGSFAMMKNVLGTPLRSYVDGQTASDAYWDMTIPGLVFAGFQGMFAVIAPALMTGAFADRLLFRPYLLFIFLWVHLVYFPWANWIWGPDGWIGKEGVFGFAGGIVVHCTAGFSALATVVALPHRKKIEGDVDTDPHNIPFVALGTGMLWFGWFGFNAGSALGANATAATAAMNTEIAASVALFTWMCVEWKHKGKPSLVGACVGTIAGLATVTPAAGYIRPWGAVIIGVVCAPFCYTIMEVIKKKLDLDDALDVFAVHGMGGYLGTILVGCLARSSVGAPHYSAKLFGKQLIAASGCAVYSFVVGFGLIKGIGAVMPLLPDKDMIFAGLDVSVHGESAYKEGSSSGKVVNPLKANNV